MGAFKKHIRIIWDGLAILAVLLVVVLCYKYKAAIYKTWDTIFPNIFEEYGDEMSCTTVAADTTTPETHNSDITDIIGYVKSLTYEGHDLRFVDLEYLLSRLPEEQQQSEEVRCLYNICHEIRDIQDGRYRHVCWVDYSSPGGNRENNILRKNIQRLRAIDEITYETYKKLHHSIKPLYLVDYHPPYGYIYFQQKYIELSDNEQKELDLERFREITTFAGILQLYNEYINYL